MANEKLGAAIEPSPESIL